MASINVTSRLEYDKVAYDKSHIVHLLLTLEGKKLESSQRKPLSLSVAIDCSGSMSGEKIDSAKKSLLKLVEHLSSVDTLAIVGFSDTVFTVLAPTKMEAEAKDHARSEIRKLHSMSATNLSGALLEAYENLRMIENSKDAIRRAFLFTDGLPTAGVTDKGALVEMADHRRPKDGSLTTFGYGQDHDPELLASMAKRGGGNFYFIKNPDDVPKAFGYELGGLLSVVAQAVKTKVKAAHGVKILEVLNDLDVEAKDDGSEAVISVDDVYAEEKRRLLLKIELPEKSKAVAVRPSTVVDVEVNFHDLRSNEPRMIEHSVKIEYVKADEAQQDADKEVTEQIALLKAAVAQEEAQKLAAAGNFAGAQAVINAAVMVCDAIGTPMADAVAHDLRVNVSACYQDEQSYGGSQNYLHSNKMSYRSGRGMTAGTRGLFGTQQQSETSESFSQGPDPAQLQYPVPHVVVTPGNPPVIIQPVQQPTAPTMKPKSVSKRRKHRR